MNADAIQGGTTAAAHPNLALVKYWGQRQAALNLPLNNSISLNLDGATTHTTVMFDTTLPHDRVVINQALASPAAAQRVSAHLDRIRAIAGVDTRALVISHNDFPAEAGVASSAAAFAALTLAATHALGLQFDDRRLSALARLGSGSACRSIPDGFVEWVAAEADEDSYAYAIAPCGHWDLNVTTIFFGSHAKEVSSLEGHRAADTSPFFTTRMAGIDTTLERVRSAILRRDLLELGLLIEREAISLHVIAMTSQPPERPWMSGIYYWQPQTLDLIQRVQQWRRQGLQVYFTLDAGPSVHLIYEEDDRASILAHVTPAIAELGAGVIHSRPGRGAWLVPLDEVPAPALDPTCRM